MDNRIEVNGVWYVREADVVIDNTALNIAYCKSLTESSDNYHFTLAVVGDNFEDCNRMPHLVCAPMEGGASEHIDNNLFLLDLYNNRVEDKDELNMYSEGDIHVMKGLVKEGIDLGWFGKS